MLGTCSLGHGGEPQTCCQRLSFSNWVVGRRYGAAAVCCGGRLSSQHSSLVIDGVEVALRSMDAKATSEPSHWRKSEEAPPLGESHSCDGATGQTDSLTGSKLLHCWLKLAPLQARSCSTAGSKLLPCYLEAAPLLP